MSDRDSGDSRGGTAAANRSERRAKPLPPEPPGYPVVGHTPGFLRRNPLDWFTELNDEYGSVVQLRIAGQRLILPTHPDAIQRVLVTNNQNYRKGGFQKMVTRSLLGNGLVLAEGEEWRRNRREIEPAFHPRRMADYRPVMRSHVDSTLDGYADGQIIDLEREMKGLTLRIIVDALFGVDLSEESWELEPAFGTILAHFERISQTYLYLPEWIPTPGNRAYRDARDTLDAAVEELIDAHRTGAGDDETVLGRLPGTDSSWSRAQLRDEVVTLLVAGHERTALLLTFTCYLLATHPTVQTDLAEYVAGQSSVGSPAAESERSILDRVQRESLRLYPPVFGIFRQPVEDDTLGGGFGSPPAR